MNPRPIIVHLLEYPVRFTPVDGEVTRRRAKHRTYMLRLCVAGIGARAALRG
jgi:hypothetical protein